MPWYPDDFIDEVTARNDIVDIVREYLPLKPSGRGYTALCPFHNEKTASFHVSPERQIYHCFGCGEGGNVITFVMAVERLDFPEAVKLLAERAGMDCQRQTLEGGIEKRGYLEIHGKFFMKLIGRAPGSITRCSILVKARLPYNTFIPGA